MMRAGWRIYGAGRARFEHFYKARLSVMGCPITASPSRAGPRSRGARLREAKELEKYEEARRLFNALMLGLFSRC